ncbi:MAG TPA: helix-turn-helix transcriptional regulator [bacterium]|jgi:ribosome-binding protein aMBF1 (putative translation factor)|nr:helix-turn-helix transcriptional regulator [bacterium]HQB09749.1 helix-turn-helix transcriptional regulator [bacterium]HQM84644.1 helix-turn-helix transcriptional regulator [bacterium]
MSSSNRKKLKIEEALNFALTPVDDNEKIEFDAMKIQMKFLFKIQDIMDKRGMSRKDLAQKMETSKAFVTQLFGSDKFLNMKTIAKLQNIFNIRIEINPVEKNADKSKNSEKSYIVAEKKTKYSS